MLRGKQVPFHPLVFGAFAVISLAIHNEGESLFQDAASALAACLILAGVSWFCINVFVHPAGKSAVATTFFLLLFFSFGQFLTVVRYLGYSSGVMQGIDPFVETTPALFFWFTLWVCLFIAGSYLIVKTSSDLRLATQFLNAASLALLVIVGVTGFQESVANARVNQYVDAWKVSVGSAGPTAPAQPADPLPNIYYIVLDGYARGDILDTLYHLDNSAFYSFLTQRGFYIARDSHSNYMQTALSFAATMNYSYLDDVANTVGPQSASRVPLIAMVNENKTFQELRAHGYKIVTFSTGSPFTDIPGRDAYLAPSGNLNAFENEMIDTTPLALLLRLPLFKSQFEFYRERILYEFDHLADTASISQPHFVFVHILAPHPPFVFQANGQSINPDRRFDYFDGSQLTSIVGEQAYIEGYRNQLAYITQRAEAAIDTVLAQSAVPPIIILQSDHGPGAFLDWTSDKDSNIPERLSILNAYLFPDRDYRSLYPSITPVNSFRVLLNRLLGSDYPLLQDKSYYSPFDHPYGFIDVSDRLGVEP